MVKTYVLSLLLVRGLLPAGLLLSIALRPFGLSFFYLLLFFIAPLTQVPDSRTYKGWRGKFLNLVVFVSVLLLLVHSVWHIVLASYPPYGSLLDSYPLIQTIGQNLGLVSYNGIDAPMAVHYLAPELVMTGTSLVVSLATRRLLTRPGTRIIQDSKHQQYPRLTRAGIYISLFLIMFSGITRPSVTSGIYFLVFLGAATAWAIGMPLRKGFAVVGKCVMAIMAVHVAGLLAYQCTWLNELYPPQKDMARYFGLTKLVNMNETLNSFVIEHSTWTTLASPLIILSTYFMLAIQTRELFKPKLMRSASITKKWSLGRGSSKAMQDSMGSVVLPDNESTNSNEEEPSLMDDIMAAVIDLFQVLVRSSYIATTITMMAWSIMYHSWLTFVLLMWANIVWLRQDQRSFMLKTSPVLVCYAILLLLAEYIYGMDLTEAELPSTISEVNLRQIGLSRSETVEPCVNLLIKSLFTCMFWVTLRQRVQDIRQRRQSAVITDMAAPLQLTVSTAASVLEAQHEEETKSRLLRALGEWLKFLCARYWIYVVVIMLFVIGITGERMTIFRIIYMFLFLAFILVFQTSWYWWRRLMYIFWIVVIIYSMLNLILIYIYQFENLSKLIETYLLINETLQHDLGLDKYHPADLFVKLLTPTLFLIMTIMQVHYFHKDFLALSEQKSRRTSMARPGSSRASNTGVSTNNDLPTIQSPDRSITEVEHSVARTIGTPQDIQSDNPSKRKSKIQKIREFVFLWTDKVFIYLEINLVKIIFLALMLLCAMNRCALHVPIMLLISPALWMSAKNQRLCVLLISALISVYLMAKMVYQIDYIPHSLFDVNCTTIETINNTEVEVMKTYNNAVWFGFSKATKEHRLVVILKGYIALIAVFTFYSLVNYRQQALRDEGVLPKDSNDLKIFPEINREHADIDMFHCLKYLVNYGFYKFGVEVTLICLIGVIGSRMDVYAVFYSGWLLLLVSSSRASQARMWLPFTAFIAFIIPLQYMLAVGFLPQICIQYPWRGDSEQMKHIRTWLFLPHADNPPHAAKIIFDYILLLFATRQRRVFWIEKTRGEDYPGGSNTEHIGSDWETPNFVNPVPDFLGDVKTCLDVLKRMVFLGMLWVTLAIMFMTGTNRVNLFSMGYLIGSFIFLWQGTDFYLRPKDAILRWWSWLLRYNVSVVAVKTILQIPGCIFSEVMQDNACWLVQLLGIGCVDKFAGGNIARFIRMHVARPEQGCSVPQEDIGLAWDGVCFAFLILQRRLFHSYYFYRVIDESKATTILASRGAELIEGLRQKQMNVQEDTETKILEKIKVKMERIKANQKKIQGAVTKDPRHHDAVRDRPQYRAPTSHQKAVRSGDYYMFDEFDDTEEQLQVEESSEDEEDPKLMGFGKSRRAQSPSEVAGPILKDTVEGEDVVESEFEDIPPEEERWYHKVQGILVTAWAFISSILISITRHLMKFSRDYRYVSRTLSLEKKILKGKPNFGIGLREGSQMIWEPLPETLATQRKDVTTLEEQDDSVFKRKKSPVLHFIYAFWYAVLAHTDIVCYIMVFINQIQSATILSIPLPLMVFLWGTLSIPRPTKTFWVTLIAYTEVIVLIKSMFQFEILPWNQKIIPDNMPFTAPRIIGIERKFNYALYDLLLLLIIFLHRFMLKSLGLWKESTPEIELREDAEYQLSPEDTQMFTEGRGEEVGKKYVVLHDKSGGPDNNDGDADRNSNFGGNDELDDGDDDHDDDDNEDVDEAGPSQPPDQYGLTPVEPVIAVTTTLENTYSHYPQVMILSIKRYLRPMRRFFTRMLTPGARVTADVYAYMFLCDFLNFMVVIFGFAAFGTHQGDGGVKAYLEENKVPIPFLIMLILQFCLIVIDRALYLRKFMLGKILFQYALIIGVHIWMFFVLPFITERTFNTLIPPPMWYMIKCIYLLLSAYQIRCGYPRRIIGNFLCKAYRFINMICFRGFMAVPFVFELRTLMDWIWTDTSMTLMDWLKMEDIFASVFLLKCSRSVEDEFPQPRGQKKSSTSKYLLGGGVLAFVIAIIWFPLVFFAFGNSVGEPNPPTDVTVKIRIGPFLPVYQMSAQSHNIDVFSEQDFTQLSNLYARDRSAQTFLSNYMYNDVAVVTLNPNSTLEWIISPPELQRLEQEALSNSSLQIKFTYVITHPSNAVPNPPTIDEFREVELEAYIVENSEAQRNPQRDTLLALLNGTADPDTWLEVKTLFPKFLKVFNKGSTKPSYQLMPPIPADKPADMRLYRDVQMRLERANGSMYWRVRENCAHTDSLASIPFNSCDMLVMYTFNDKLFPETLSIISGSGIIGLYTTFVFLASRVLRGFFSGIYTKIMFDDLPNVDRVLQLCLDIYLVREALELTLEEDLFAKLVFLYRSPETMIKWSRPKDELRALPPSR